LQEGVRDFWISGEFFERRCARNAS